MHRHVAKCQALIVHPFTTTKNVPWFLGFKMFPFLSEVVYLSLYDMYGCGFLILKSLYFRIYYLTLVKKYSFTKISVMDKCQNGKALVPPYNLESQRTGVVGRPAPVTL